MVSPELVLGEFPVDEYRPIKVIVIGAGIGGILAAIRHVVTSLFIQGSIKLMNYPVLQVSTENTECQIDGVREECGRGRDVVHH